MKFHPRGEDEPINDAFRRWLDRIAPHDDDFAAQAEEWTAKPFSPETRAEVERLIQWLWGKGWCK